MRTFTYSSTFYRPPSCKVDIFEKIENLIQNLDDESKEIILAGDVNCDLLTQMRALITQIAF